MDTPTLPHLLDSFNARLVALEAVDTGSLTDSTEAQWDKWPVIELRVREDWRQGQTHQEIREGNWDKGEPAYPTVEWETASKDAVYWDDTVDLQIPEGTFGFQRFAVDPERIQVVLDLVEAAPLVSDEQRAGQLADHIADV